MYTQIQTLTCRNFGIFYFTSRLTLYKCAVKVCIQRQFLIRKWTISKVKALKEKKNQLPVAIIALGDVKVLVA